MQFPQSPHAEAWLAQMPAQRPLPELPLVSRDADAVSPPLHSRRFHTAAMVCVPCPTVFSDIGITIARPFGTRAISRSRMPSSGGLIRSSAKLIASSGARILGRSGAGS